jgi:hypothetical protein
MTSTTGGQGQGGGSGGTYTTTTTTTTTFNIIISVATGTAWIGSVLIYQPTKPAWKVEVRGRVRVSR